MRFILRVARNRWFNTFLLSATLAALIWFIGPLFAFGTAHPFETEIARWITIAGIFVLWLVLNLLRELRERKKEKELTEGIAEQAPDPNATASAEEIALLSDRLKEALKTLKKAKGSSGSKKLSQLPWYMFIGPPGSGKTTALVNCGLNFPLAEGKDGGALKGVGGTRNCDWWFTDDAVLIDTAGRYTTQDSQAAVDNAAWLGFLRMLKKQRNRQPINGVLVAISLSDLAMQSEDERLTHARAIRKRIKELQDELGVRMPVYVLFTKADLISGFNEFFDNLGAEERAQVWGVTLPFDAGKDEDGAVAGFPAAFDALMGRLNDRLMERVNQETDLGRRRAIYGFPQQLASLRDVAAQFMSEAFKPSRLEARSLLRGVYLTSGTQNGTPIDRLLGTMANEFGLPRQAVSAFSGKGRAYFLTRLVKEVIFGEAALVGLDPKVEKRARLFSYATYAACAALLLLLAGAWFASYIGNRDLIASVHLASGIYNQQITELQKRGPQDADLAAVIQPLNTLRLMRGGYEERDQSIPVSLTFGLYQGEKLGNAASEAYVRALNGLLLPRLIARAESQVVQRLNQPEFLYQVLKVYLVLGRKGPLDGELVMQWLDADLLATYPSEEQTPVREMLLAHTDAMLKQPLTTLALNDALIAQARAVLNRQPLAEYSYNRLLRSKRVLAVPTWTVAENGGPESGRVFQMRSGKGLDTGVQGIYTWAGYHNVFLPLLPTITQDLAEDSWVLGKPQRDVASTLRDTQKLRRDVMGLYLNDYERVWDRLLAEVAIKPFGNMQEMLDLLSRLSAAASPLRDLLVQIDLQTQLSRKSAADAAVSQAQGRATAVGQRVSTFAQFQARSGLTISQQELVNIMSEAFGTDPSGKPIEPAQRVDMHFKTLHDFVTAPEGRKAPMEAMIERFNAMYQGYNQAANAPNQNQVLLNQMAAGGGGGGAAAAQQLQSSTRDMPAPIAAMVTNVTQQATQVTTAGASREMGDAWRSRVLPLCEAAFNRYPLVANSPNDVPVDDFGRLLAPGGMMDQFFDQYLKPFVDTAAKPWKWLSPDRTPLGFSLSSLAEFERAAQIRDALFSGGKEMQVRFQLVPVSLDPQIGQMVLDIAGQQLTFTHGPPESARFQWPGAGGKTLVRITLTPTSGGQAATIEKDGPWALLRMLDAARVTPSGQPDKFRITFSGAGGSGTFELLATSVNNPFTMTALRSFRCPPKL